MASIKTLVVPVIGGTTEYNYREVVDFEMFSDFDIGLPYGKFVLRDATGQVFKKFENLQIGSEIWLKIISDNEKWNDKIYKNYVIMKLATTKEGQYSNKEIIIYFAHKLLIASDNKNHAYPAKNCSSLVKYVLNSKARGFQIKLESKSKTDDMPKPRYKLCEDEWHFLKEKIEPFSKSKDSPCYLFGTFESKFYFNSFKDLYSKNASFVGMPINTDGKASNEIKNPKSVLNVKSFNFSIGGTEIMRQINAQCFVDAPDQLTTATMSKTPQNKNTEKKTFIPLDMNYSIHEGIPVVVRNRHLAEGINYIIGHFSNKLDNMFEVSLDADFDLNAINIGKTVDLYFNEGHWANGKWLVFKSAVTSDKKQTDNLSMTITLCRPSFNYKSGFTELGNTMTLYSV